MERYFGQMVVKIRANKPEEEKVWQVIDQVIDELIENKDIIETTFREATVSYLVERLESNDLLTEKAFESCHAK